MTEPTLKLADILAAVLARLEYEWLWLDQMCVPREDTPP